MTREELAEYGRLVHPDWPESKIQEKVDIILSRHLLKNSGENLEEKNQSEQ